MNIHLSRAANLLKFAVLPDRTISRTFSAALNGAGESKSKAALKGLGEDAFEVVANPVKAAIEIGRAIKG